MYPSVAPKHPSFASGLLSRFLASSHLSWSFCLLSSTSCPPLSTPAASRFVLSRPRCLLFSLHPPRKLRKVRLLSLDLLLSRITPRERAEVRVQLSFSLSPLRFTDLPHSGQTECLPRNTPQHLPPPLLLLRLSLPPFPAAQLPLQNFPFVRVYVVRTVEVRPCHFLLSLLQSRDEADHDL
jgi:hypothetical protein